MPKEDFWDGWDEGTEEGDGEGESGSDKSTGDSWDDRRVLLEGIVAAGGPEASLAKELLVVHDERVASEARQAVIEADAEAAQGLGLAELLDAWDEVKAGDFEPEYVKETARRLELAKEALRVQSEAQRARDDDLYLRNLRKALAMEGMPADEIEKRVAADRESLSALFAEENGWDPVESHAEYQRVMTGRHEKQAAIQVLRDEVANRDGETDRWVASLREEQDSAVDAMLGSLTGG